MDLNQMGQQAKQAAYHLATLTTKQKNHALQLMADELITQMPSILEANAKDISAAREAGLSDALIDRLFLDQKRLQDIADDVKNVITLEDPVGQEFDTKQLGSGLSLVRRRVPLGVVGVIYEARPNVTIDIAALCLKTGNASILRGGKETRYTNQVLIQVVQQALLKAELPSASVQAIDDPDRALVSQLLKLDQYVDMIIPRGGQSLHQMCKENSTIPVIIGGFGISHIYVDDSAKIEQSIAVIDNAKRQRPSACNSLDTLLIHKDIAEQFLPKLIEKWQDPQSNKTVEFVVDENAQQYFSQTGYKPAQAGDFDTEWLSYTCGIKLVDNIEQAIAHMQEHNASHSDAIMTENPHNAALFVQSAGSAAVYVNASTRFTDGAQFGLGAEVAVSTQKLHARGPMGLEELTSYQWVGKGDYLARS